MMIHPPSSIPQSHPQLYSLGFGGSSPWCWPVTRSLGMCVLTTGPACRKSSQSRGSLTFSSSPPTYTVASARNRGQSRDTRETTAGSGLTSLKSKPLESKPPPVSP